MSKVFVSWAKHNAIWEIQDGMFKFREGWMKPLINKILGVSTAILVGALSLWMVRTSSVWSVWAIGAKEALCVLDLQGGRPKVSAPFTTSETLERFFVVARPEAKAERLSLTITREERVLCSAVITKAMRFSFSPG